MYGQYGTLDCAFVWQAFRTCDGYSNFAADLVSEGKPPSLLTVRSYGSYHLLHKKAVESPVVLHGAGRPFTLQHI